MVISLETALARFTTNYWNSGSVSDANPGGFGANGHQVNLPAIAEAMGVVGARASEGAEAADAAEAAAIIATTKAGEASDNADAAGVSAAAALAAVGGVRVSANDADAGPLSTKLVAGDGVTLTEIDDGGSETLRVSAAPIGNAAGPVNMNGHAFTLDETLFDKGAEVKQQETAEPAAVSGAQGPYAFKERWTLWLHINGDTSISITAPTDGYLGGGMVVAITQGTGGGHDFTFTGATWVGAELDFTALAVDDVTHLSLFYTATGTLCVSHFLTEVA